MATNITFHPGEQSTEDAKREDDLTAVVRFGRRT